MDRTDKTQSDEKTVEADPIVESKEGIATNRETAETKRGLRKLAFDIEEIWGKVCAEKATRSWGRERTRWAIVQWVASEVITLPRKSVQFMFKAGFGRQSDLARWLGVSRQAISKNVKKYEFVTVKKTRWFER